LKLGAVFLRLVLPRFNIFPDDDYHDLALI